MTSRRSRTATSRRRPGEPIAGAAESAASPSRLSRRFSRDGKRVAADCEHPLHGSWQQVEPATCLSSWQRVLTVPGLSLRPQACRLGYNPMKQICQPRPVGWISTYEKATRVPHIAPCVPRHRTAMHISGHLRAASDRTAVQRVRADLILVRRCARRLRRAAADGPGQLSVHFLPHRYSFFADVGRGERPMVAFSASRRPEGTLKDAHKGHNTCPHCFL